MKHDITDFDAPPNLVWHYTSPDGLSGILEHNVLWATSASYMNDSHELSSGNRALRKHFKKRRSSLDPNIADQVKTQVSEHTIDASSAYIVSASKDGDSLTLWRNYGKHAIGYAIGLDRARPLIPLQASEAEEHPNPPEGWEAECEETEDGYRVEIYDPDRPVADYINVDDTQWVSVVYDGKLGSKEIVESTFDAIVEEVVNPKPNRLFVTFHWLSHLLLIKAKGFKDEREVRISYTLIAPDWKFLFFRATQWGTTPYIKLTSAPENFDTKGYYAGSGEDYARKPDKLPIVHIRIGPTPYRRAAKKALRQLLERYGYSHVKISASKIPYR